MSETKKTAEELRTAINERICEYLEDRLKKVDEIVDGVVLRQIQQIAVAFIGIDTTWSQWKVDEKSALGREIGRRAADLVRSKVDDFMNLIAPSNKTKTQLREMFQQEFDRAFSLEVGRAIRDYAQAAARSELDKLTQEWSNLTPEDRIRKRALDKLDREERKALGFES